MCSQTDFDRIQGKVAEFVGEGKVFTAFDVTKALRAEFTDFEERHRGVRRAVRNLFGNGSMVGYECSATDINANGTVSEVLMYYPQGGNATDHPLAVKDTGMASAGVTQPVAVQPFTGAAEDEDGAVPTKDKRINIPKFVLNNVQGDTVTVNVKGKTFTYTKNKDGRVRVSLAHLPNAQPTYAVSFDASKNEIVVV